jgi:hypothetical protein
MRKTIWTCWFQGRENAPALVKSCLNSWERQNPNWELRCLDATNVQRYVPLSQYIDLNKKTLTAASLSDVLRILLLHEFGGLWVDATLLCNRPLDDWLPDVMGQGFFAFAAPAPGRPLASWFLGADAHHDLVSAWCRQTIAYWSNRTASDDYFWFHHLFGDLVQSDPQAAQAWARVPKVSAEGPHKVQYGVDMHRPKAEVEREIDWATPVFKLTHRVSEAHSMSGSLLEHLLQRQGNYQSADQRTPRHADAAPGAAAPKCFAALKVSTENLGDHVQIIAALRMLSRLGIEPARFIDRDDEIKSAPSLDDEAGPVGIILNGWFKTNPAEWPPHPKLLPLIIGFHIRPFQCPELLSDASIDFFRRHQPIGCRDVHTEALLRSRGVEAFTSNCLSLVFSRRIEDPKTQTEVFIVSRDQRIMDHLPRSIAPYTFLSHYTGSKDFAANMARAQQFLEIFRSRARLIVTSLLHCALPAIAMGIPVVVFYPINSEIGHASDRERFSSLERLIRVYRLDEIDSVDWNPQAIDAGEIKLQLLDRFYDMAARWRLAAPQPLGPIAPANALPLP